MGIYSCFSGAFVLNYFAKRLKLQIDFAKVSMGLAWISGIILLVALNTYDNLWLICLAFGGFGFFGYAAFPMSLELAAEESYPIDPSVSEGCVHIMGNLSAIILVTLGNNLYKSWDEDNLPPNQCLSDGSTTIGVSARDYTPYYYVIMGLCTVMSFIFIVCMNPSMRRSHADENEIQNA